MEAFGDGEDREAEVRKSARAVSQIEFISMASQTGLVTREVTVLFAQNDEELVSVGTAFLTLRNAKDNDADVAVTFNAASTRKLTLPGRLRSLFPHTASLKVAEDGISVSMHVPENGTSCKLMITPLAGSALDADSDASWRVALFEVARAWHVLRTRMWDSMDLPRRSRGAKGRSVQKLQRNTERFPVNLSNDSVDNFTARDKPVLSRAPLEGARTRGRRLTTTSLGRRHSTVAPAALASLRRQSAPAALEVNIGWMRTAAAGSRPNRAALAIAQGGRQPASPCSACPAGATSAATRRLTSRPTTSQCS